MSAAEIKDTAAVKAAPPKQTEAKEELRFTISSSPHIRDGETIPHIMWQVNLALLPAALFAIYWFGLPALRLFPISCGRSTWLCCRRFSLQFTGLGFLHLSIWPLA